MFAFRARRGIFLESSRGVPNRFRSPSFAVPAPVRASLRCKPNLMSQRPARPRFGVIGTRLAAVVAATRTGPGSSFDSMVPTACVPAQTHSALLAAIAQGDTGKLIARAVSEERARRTQGGASNVHAPPRASIVADHELNWPGTPAQVHAAFVTTFRTCGPTQPSAT